MAMTLQRLERALRQNMVPVTTEAEAVDGMVAVWDRCFYQAAVNGSVATPGSLAGALSAMGAALTGISTDTGLAMQNGFIAFWGVVATSAAAIWVFVPPAIAATPPPLLGTIKATLDPVFAANTAAGLGLDASALAIATVLHPLNLGGIATYPTPPAGLGPLPIL